MQDFILKHRDRDCAALLIDEVSGALSKVRILDPESAPFIGGATEQKLKRWWESRAVPGSRRMMQKVIQDAGLHNSKEYLIKNLALSITDNYWICPVENDTLKWNDVCLFNLGGYGQAILPYHNATSYDPNASLGGQMEKYWDMGTQPPVLVKHAFPYFGQQAVNEAFASELHQRQQNSIRYVAYTVERSSDGSLISKCDAFTTKNLEFVPAYEIIESEKKDRSLSDYENYIQICKRHGIPEDVTRTYLDYQTMMDFVISNTDRHFMNFGVLRDAKTLQLVSHAPIFDHGNSMFYTHTGTMKPFSRVALLEIKISSFHKCEEKMLRHVKNKRILDLDALPNPKAVKDFYCMHGIPEEKAHFLSGNYETKVHMVKEFQNGHSISLYHEKHIKR